MLPGLLLLRKRFLPVLVNGIVESLRRQVRTVHFYRRKAAQLLRHILVGYGQGFIQGLPLAISVSTLLQAISRSQPKVLNLISVMTSSLTLRYTVMVSPRGELPLSPTASASLISPTLRGW